MSTKRIPRRVQQDLFQPQRTRLTLRTFPVPVQKKTVGLLVELLRESRRVPRSGKEVCDER